MAELTFLGLEPWAAGIEIVDCVTPDGLVDLHNECQLLRTTLSCEPLPAFGLEFAPDRHPKPFALRFRGVRELSFRQDELTYGAGLWDPNVVSTFIGLEFRTTDDAPAFTVRTIVGDYTFRCDEVEFRWATS